MYATVEQLVESYGWTEFSQLLSDELGLVTEALLKDLVSEADTSEYSADILAAGQAALVRAERALEKQSNFIDSKLVAVYSLPIATELLDATPLEDCCLALTRAALADDGDNLSTTMKEERKHWRDWLDQIAAGKAFLPGVPRTSNEGSVNQRLTGKPNSSVCWDSYS